MTKQSIHIICFQIFFLWLKELLNHCIVSESYCIFLLYIVSTNTSHRLQCFLLCFARAISFQVDRVNLNELLQECIAVMVDSQLIVVRKVLRTGNGFHWTTAVLNMRFKHTSWPRRGSPSSEVGTRRGASSAVSARRGASSMPEHPYQFD